MKSIRRSILATLLVAGVTAPAAHAVPNLLSYASEGVFYADGTGNVTVNFLYSLAANDNELHFFASVGGLNTLLLTVPGSFPLPGSATPPGTANFSVAPGAEVIFGICTGSWLSGGLCSQQIWYMGPASRNALSGGGIQAALLTAEEYNNLANSPGNATAGWMVFGFEDIALPNSDMDYNDLIFEVSGVSVVPEPATMGLLALGLVGLAAASRRQRKSMK